MCNAEWLRGDQAEPTLAMSPLTRRVTLPRWSTLGFVALRREDYVVGLTTAAQSPCHPAREPRSTIHPIVISTTTTRARRNSKNGTNVHDATGVLHVSHCAGRLHPRGRVSEPSRVAG